MPPPPLSVVSIGREKPCLYQIQGPPATLPFHAPISYNAGMDETGASANDDRMTTVEIKLAWLEDFVRQLQGQTVELAHKVERLEAENKSAREKIRDLSDALEDIPNRKPPHY
jgi:SlyX protein